MKLLTRTLPIIAIATTNISLSSYAHAIADTDCSDIPRLEKEVKAGELQSTFDLGVCYHMGKGVTKSVDTAFKHYSKAAEGGLPLGMLHTGYFYERGIGSVKKDLDKAVSLISKAAHTGLTSAEISYGVMFLWGAGVKKDSDEALKWISKGIEKKAPRAYFVLGNSHLYGSTLKKDKAKALSYFLKAAEYGWEKRSASFIKNLYRGGNGVPYDNDEAFKWAKKDAESGRPQALNDLAEYHFYGRGTPRDAKKSVELYQQSAAKGDRTAKLQLMNTYFVGGGNVKRDLDKARKLAAELANDPNKNGYQRQAKKILAEINAEERGEETTASKSTKLLKSLTQKTPPLKLKIEADCSNVKLSESKAKKGDLQSLIGLSICYTNGDGVTQSYETGFNHAKQAAKADSPMGNYIVGVYYNLGTFVKKDNVEAAKWYLKAANDGLANAQHMMGVFHTAGTGVPKNMATAGQWFKKAIEQKYTPSLMYLGRQLGGPFTKNKKALEASFSYYAKAFEYGDMKALYPLSQMLKDGRGVPKDEKGAFELAELYLDTGSAFAYQTFSEYYLKGIGTKKNVDKAISLLKKAVDMDDHTAMLKLMNLYYEGKEITKDVAEAGKWAELLSSKSNDWKKEKADELLKKIKEQK